MGNKIAPLQHSCLAFLGTCAEGVQFYCPSHMYPAIHYSSILSNFIALCIGLILKLAYWVTRPQFNPLPQGPFNSLPPGVGEPPRGFQPQPGSPGGGGVPRGNTRRQAQDLLDRLDLSGLPVAVFPPYADGLFVSPRTGFRTFATIYTDTNNRFNRYFFLVP